MEYLAVLSFEDNDYLLTVNHKKFGKIGSVGYSGEPSRWKLISDISGITNKQVRSIQLYREYKTKDIYSIIFS